MSSYFILTEDTSFRIISDIKKGTPKYFDEVRTNSSGVAIFNLDELFDQYGKKDEKVAYFTVYAKDTTTYQTVGTARAKAYLTSTESIIWKNSQPFCCFLRYNKNNTLLLTNKKLFYNEKLYFIFRIFISCFCNDIYVWVLP